MTLPSPSMVAPLTAGAGRGTAEVLHDQLELALEPSTAQASWSLAPP